MQKYLYLNQTDRKALNRAISEAIKNNMKDIAFTTDLKAVNSKLGEPKAPVVKPVKEVKAKATKELVEVPAAKKAPAKKAAPSLKAEPAHASSKPRKAKK